ncbi:MAG: efflux RND transporter periplasmic adaptor subunit [Gemmatimonadota bacterium]
MNKVTKLALFGVIAVSALAGFAWTQSAKPTRSTDNAYVGADAIPVATQIAGRVTQVYVKPNAAVAAGEPLLDLDDRPYRVAIERAQAKLAQARLAARESLAEVAAAEADVKRTEHQIGQARTRVTRANDLARRGFIAPQSAEDAQAQLSIELASLDAARARLVRARTEAYANVDQHPAVLAALAELRQAELDLEYTHVRAPAAGRATNMKLTVGTQVQANAPLFMLVSEQGYWVDANFKEGELPGIAPGQGAEIELDALPGTHFKGVVESISPGTGAAFALLPPQNATGNWVKTAQRVPVRIRLTELARGTELPIGASANVTVHVR